MTRPIRQRPLAIGLRSPAGDEAVPEGSEAKLEIIALDRDGKRVAANGLRFELLRETWQYDWYSVNGSWRHRSRFATSRSRPEPSTSRRRPGDPGAQLPAGRYRWEVSDPASGAQSSLRFHVGW